MESRFGEAFDGVRVHNDSASAKKSDSLGAYAFTQGNDIYFGSGAYQPNSKTGQQLIAHELTHVIQQKKGTKTNSPKLYSNQKRSSLEAEADHASQQVMDGNTVSISGVASGPPQMQLKESTSSSADVAESVETPSETEAVPTTETDNAETVDAIKEELPSLMQTGLALNMAGYSINLPGDLFRGLSLEERSIEITIPSKYNLPGLSNMRLTVSADENLQFESAQLSANFEASILKDGSITGNVDGDGNVSASVVATINAERLPALQEAQISGEITPTRLQIETDVGLAISDQISGAFHIIFTQDAENEQPLVEGSATATYEGDKLQGEITLNYESEAITGSGQLSMELFSGFVLTANATVDENADVAVKLVGEYQNEIELFKEWKKEVSFFDFEKSFPLWGLYFPLVGTVGIIAEIGANAGFRGKFGPGVLRGIEISGEFGTDPEAAMAFGITGELFIPAGAEIVVTISGGVGLSAAVVDLVGGINLQGIAGIYGALSARPTFAYENGNYTVSGEAVLEGVAQLKAGVNAFAKLSANLLFTSVDLWEKQWNLAEWSTDLGLNAALRLGFTHTLGQEPQVTMGFETGTVDAESLISQAMPESGEPVRAPPKPPAPDNATLNVNGEEGEVDEGAAKSLEAPTAGSPPVTKQKGEVIESDTPPAGSQQVTPQKSEVTKSEIESDENSTNYFWDEEVVFTADDGRHEIDLEGNAENAEVIVSSKPRLLRQIIYNDKAWNGIPLNSTDLKKLEEHALAIEGFIRTKSRKYTESQAKDGITKHLKEISKILTSLEGAENSLIPVEIEHASTTKLNPGEGGSAVWSKLSMNTDKSGSTSTPSSPLNDWLKDNYPEGKWVMGHLLAASLFGKGEPKNLTPITEATNKKHSTDVEQPIRNSIMAKENSTDTRNVEYNVIARYTKTQSDFPLDNVAKGFDIEARKLEYDPETKAWHATQEIPGITKWIENDLSMLNGHSETNTSSVVAINPNTENDNSRLSKISGVGTSTGEKGKITILKAERSVKFVDVDDFIARVGISSNHQEKLRTQVKNGEVIFQ